MVLRGIVILGLYIGICAHGAIAAEPGAKETEEPLLPWIEVQSVKVGTRYNFIASDLGVVSKNHQQHKESFAFRIRFDREGKYSLNFGGGSGSSFSSSWDGMGIGSDASSNLNFRELFLQLKPMKGLELQYGGITPARGVSTEITTYDNDAYLVGARVSIKRPSEFFFDELSGALAYLGDLNEPDVFHRVDRFDQANYHQILASKKIGNRAVISGDYASLSGVAVLHQAVQVKTPEIKALDSIRFENYQRIDGDRGCGFALQGDRKIAKWLQLGGGFASIDRNYGGLNADRFNKGKRIFATAKVDIVEGLSGELFVQKALANDYSIPNDVRFDAALTYDLLPALRKSGVFRIAR